MLAQRGDHLGVRRVGEEVHGNQARRGIALMGKELEVAYLGRGVAADVDDGAGREGDP